MQDEAVRGLARKIGAPHRSCVRDPRFSLEPIAFRARQLAVAVVSGLREGAGSIVLGGLPVEIAGRRIGATGLACGICTQDWEVAPQVGRLRAIGENLNVAGAGEGAGRGDLAQNDGQVVTRKRRVIQFVGSGI